MKQVKNVKRVKVVVQGLVQGVGFRAWTKREAQARSLTGWVKNCSDGSVEAVLQGEVEDVDAMLEAMKCGPRFSQVDSVEATAEVAPEDFDAFEIL